METRNPRSSAAAPLVDPARKRPILATDNAPDREDVLPTIRVDASGTIVTMSEPALAMLDRTGHDYNTCFFAHLNRRNLLPVMRDVASMVCHGKKTARWLVQMRTGRNGWRWIRAAAIRVPTPGSCEIRITLTNVGD